MKCHEKSIGRIHNRLACLHTAQRSLVAFVAMSFALLIFSAPGTAEAQGRADEVSKIRKDLTSAMAKPLSQRVPLLETLEQRLDTMLKEDRLSAEGRVNIQFLHFRIKQNQAKYPESQSSFGKYVAAVKRAFPEKRGRALTVRVLDRIYRRGDKAEAVELIDQAMTVYTDDTEVTPFLLLRKAQALKELPGRRSEGIEPAQRIVEQYPESPYRPDAMKVLAHLQVMASKDDASLSTLKLLENMYRGSWWEQWAHIQQADIWERRKGEPQKALALYTESLKKFPNHHFAGYVRDQIARLQKVIEEQLIKDALEGLGKADDQPNPQVEQKVGQAEPTEATGSVSPKTSQKAVMSAKATS